MSKLGNYRFHFARSGSSVANLGSKSMDFHFRARKFLDVGNPPFLRLDPAKSVPLRVFSYFDSPDQRRYTISIWVEETNNIMVGSVLSINHVFSKPESISYDNITVKVIVHLKDLNGTTTSSTHTEESDTVSGQPTTKKIVHDQIPIEFPAVD